MDSAIATSGETDILKSRSGRSVIGNSLIVVGDPASIRVAAAAFEESRTAPLGAVLIETEDHPVRLGGLDLLGVASDLSALHAKLGFSAALVSAPAGMSAPVERACAALKRLGVEVRRWACLDDVLAEEPETPDTPSPIAAAATWRPQRSINVLDLVGRAPRPLNHELACAAIAGKRVLITGAGGSIGSELARIAAALEPEQLVLMDRSENALFEIDRSIKTHYPQLSRRALLHDVVDAPATLRHMVHFRPQIVFHAAAHKHVPMMEDHPAHAVNNNLFGAKAVADAAVEVGAERFVMISTDKAANPSSVMGATKRFAELYTRSLNGKGDTKLCMVRFGNVLASACSVLPIWEAQLLEGGPVTVTDRRMTRFFMTIPEAASLVIQTAALDDNRTQGADVFVLDMGEPVSILSLAERFIRAHGCEPVVVTDGDALPVIPGRCVMPIIITGARPGEKLHEELAHQGEELRPTPTPGVLSWAGPAIDKGQTARMLEDMSAVRRSVNADEVIETIRRWTPTLLQKRGVRPMIVHEHSSVT